MPGNLAVVKCDIEMVQLSVSKKRRHRIAGEVSDAGMARVEIVGGLRWVRPQIAKARRQGKNHSRRQADQYSGGEKNPGAQARGWIRMVEILLDCQPGRDKQKIENKS